MLESRDEVPPATETPVFSTGPPPRLPVRIAMGFLFGGIWGLFEIFVYPSLRFVAASALAGGTYFAIIAALGGRFTLLRWRAAAAGGLAGIVGGTLWCVVSGAPLPLIAGCVIGGSCGAILAVVG